MFRWALGIIAGLAWLTAFWLSTHVSDDPLVLGRWSAGYAFAIAGIFGVAIVLTLCHFGRAYRRLHAARHGIALLVISTLLTAAGIEIFIRVSDLIGISYYEESQRYFLDRIPDEALVFRHRTHRDATYQGVRVVTNEMGLRDRPIGLKQPGELRILFLGDSIVFGWGVPEENTFVRRLEAGLAKDLGRPVRVINSGVSGYNTEQELAFLGLRGPEIAPDLVLLMYLANDIEINEGPYNPAQLISLEGKNPPEMLKTLLGRSWAYRFAVHVIENSGGPKRTAAPRNSPGWKRSLGALEAMAGYCRERRIPFVVFLYDVVPGVTTRALGEDIAALAANLGFAFSSSRTWLSGTPPRAFTNSVVDPHPNRLGHELLSKGMLDYLLAHRNLIDRR